MIVVVNASFYGGDKEITSIVDQPTYPDVEYVLYTNRPELAEGTVWRAVEVLDYQDNPRLGARRIKTLIHDYHPDKEYWLWIDSNMKLEVDPHELVNKYLNKHDLCALPHPERNDWVEEAQMVANQRDSIENVQRAVSTYYSEGFPPTTLYETGCLLRRNSQTVREFNADWWYQIQHNSIRDQLSFPYAAWKNGLAINTFPGTNSTNALRYEAKKQLPQWEEITRAWN